MPEPTVGPGAQPQPQARIIAGPGATFIPIPLPRSPVGIKPFNPAPMREWARLGIAVALLFLLFGEVAVFLRMAVLKFSIDEIKDLIGVIFVPTIALATAAIAFYFAGDR